MHLINPKHQRGCIPFQLCKASHALKSDQKCQFVLKLDCKPSKSHLATVLSGAEVQFTKFYLKLFTSKIIIDIDASQLSQLHRLFACIIYIHIYIHILLYIFM